MILDEEEKNEIKVEDNDNNQNTDNEEVKEEIKEPLAERKDNSEISSVNIDLSSQEELKKKIQADSIDGIYNPQYSSNVNNKETSFESLISFKEGDDVEKIFDEKREPYLKETKKKKKMSLILNLSLIFVILPALVVMILSTIKVGEKAIISFSWVPITTISIALAFVIALLVVKHIFDKKHQKITHDYFYFYLNAVSAYSLKDMNITDGKIAAEGTMKDDLLIQAHYFAQIFSISSRGLVVGKKDGKDFTYGEIACASPYKTKEQAYAIPSPIYDLADGSELPYIPAASDETTGNKKKNVFDNQTQSYGMLGRMLCLNNKVTPDESFIIALRGKMNDTVMPDYIKNYKPYQDKRLGDKIIIYLATDEGKKFFNDENIDLLSKFTIDDVVTSGFVTVNSYGSKIALNLSDSLMVLPIENKVNVSSLDSLRVSLNTLVKFVENCIKDSSYEDKDEKEDNQAEENKVEEKKEEENKLEDEVPSKE